MYPCLSAARLCCRVVVLNTASCRSPSLLLFHIWYVLLWWHVGPAGTFTLNYMDFRKMCVRAVSYGRGMTQIGLDRLMREGRDVRALKREMEENEKKERVVPHVNFIDGSDTHPNHSVAVRCVVPIRSLCGGVWSCVVVWWSGAGVAWHRASAVVVVVHVWECTCCVAHTQPVHA